MTEKLFLEVLTPQKKIVDEEVKSVVAKGSEGEFGVLKGHTSFLTSLEIGTLRYRDLAGKENLLFVNCGFAEVLPDKMIVLSDSSEQAKDIDVKRALRAKERALKRLELKAADIDIIRAKAALQRALHRLKIK